MSAFDPSAPGLPIVGGSGGLPEATGANQLLVSDGAGTDYTPTDREDVMIAGFDSLLSHLAEGDFLVGSGGPESGTASDHAAAVRAIIGVGETTTTYYASNGTAANGAGPDATASVSGTGAASTVTFGVSSTTRTVTSSAINAATWVSPSIPRAAKRITLYLRTTAFSGIVADDFRALVMCLRRASENPPANFLLGANVNGGSRIFTGNHRSAGNNASYNCGVYTNCSPLSGTNRWLRVVWVVDEAPRVWISQGATTGATRPTAWNVLNLDSQTQAATATVANTNLGTLGTSDVQVLVALESYGTGSASLATVELALEVET